MSNTKKQFYVINKTENGYAEIYIYGVIGDDWSESGVTSSQFVKDLKELEKKYDTIKVRINSGGGSVLEGIAIFNAIRACKTNTEAYIDGLAASMALPVAMACKQVYISKYGMVMTHKASGGAYGSAEEMKRYAELMETLENNILSIFAERTGCSVEDCRKKYFNTTDRWIKPAEAVAEGLVDGIYDGAQVEAPANATVADLVNIYGNVLNQSIHKNENSDSMNTIKLEVTAALLGAWGLPTDATADAVATAVNGAFAKAKQYDDVKSKLDTANATIATLQNQGAADQVKALLDEAQAEGKAKITNATRAKLEKQYENPTAQDVQNLKDLLETFPVINSVVDGLKPDSAGDQQYKELANLSMVEMMEKELAADCWTKYPQLFKQKWVEAYGQESWEKSSYSKKVPA